MLILTYSIVDNYKDALSILKQYRNGCNTSDLQSEAVCMRLSCQIKGTGSQCKCVLSCFYHVSTVIERFFPIAFKNRPKMIVLYVYLAIFGLQ